MRIRTNDVTCQQLEQKSSTVDFYSIDTQLILKHLTFYHIVVSFSVRILARLRKLIMSGEVVLWDSWGKVWNQSHEIICRNYQNSRLNTFKWSSLIMQQFSDF